MRMVMRAFAATWNRAGVGRRGFNRPCRMDLEGIVAKRLDAPYRFGRSRRWIKTKNPGSRSATQLGAAEGYATHALWSKPAEHFCFPVLLP
jgi:ATP-dependent DNA ligase